MSDWKEGFYEAVRVHCGLPEGSRVTNVEEEQITEGYCETCYYESTETTVSYIDPKGESRTYSSYMSMAEFMNSL